MVSRPLLDDLPCGTHRLFESALVCIGTTRCPEPRSELGELGPIRRHVFVFPSAPVWVARAGEEPYVADANRVLFHGEGDEMRRRALDGSGACGTWFAIDYELLLPHLERRTHALGRRGCAPFCLRHARCSGAAFRAQALLVRELRRGTAEPLRVEESALRLLDEVLDVAYGETPASATSGGRCATQRRHERLVEETRAWFGVHFRSGATLTQIAAAVGASPFHLARVFRAHTDLSLHAYRNQLRLRAATLAILAGEHDLSRLALDFGFASHSHLTDAFRAANGFPPSALRKMT